MTALLQAVLDDMERVGVAPSDPRKIAFDTPNVVRFHVRGDKPGTLNGYARLFSDGVPAGVFGSWKLGAQHVWCAKRQDQLSADDLAAVRARIEAAQREREAELVLAHEKAAKMAQSRFMAIPAASPNHGYLSRKKIQPFTARQDGSLLVLALQDFDGEIRSLQTIAPNGRKKLMTGGAKKGFHIPVSDQGHGRLLICEGFATGASLAEMFPDDGVIASVDAGNLPPVAQAARAKFPDREIIIAADNDATGLRFANRAARAIGALLMVPSTPGADWNDEFTKGVRP